MSDDPKPDPAKDPEKDPPANDPKPETDWKAEARKWEQRAKDNTEAAKKLADLEEANKTELQKAQDAAKAADERAAKAEQSALRASVASDKGVPAGSLTGSTQEELEKSADELIAWRDGAKKKAPPPKQLKSGASKDDDDEGGKGRAAAALRSLRQSG